MKQISIARLTRFYDYKFGEGYAFAGHTHEDWEINLILQGRMSITYGGDVMTLSEGDLFVGEPWGFHCNRAIGKDTHMAVIHFTDTDAPTGKGRGYSVRTLTQDEFSAARLMLSELSESTRDSAGAPVDPENGCDCGNAKKLCEVLVSQVIGASKNETENSSPNVRLYREAVKYMEENVRAKLTISDISRALHVSPALLKRVFREFTGGGVMSFFSGMKIRLSKKLLEKGLGISIVSDTLGFSSQCYFSSVFSKVTGETPKAYQKRSSSYERR